MKKDLLRFGLSLIALFVMVVANAQTYQNEEASVSWPFNDANYATQYTKSPEKGFSLVSVNTGDLKYVAKTSTKTLDKNGSRQGVLFNLLNGSVQETIDVYIGKALQLSRANTDGAT